MFIIKGHPYDFQTGLTKDNRQVLMGLLCPNLVAYFFSAEGNFLGRMVRLWNYPAPRMKSDGPFQIYDKEFQRRLAEQMAEWKSEIGFEPEGIRVKQFFDEDQCVGIALLPQSLADLEWCEDEEEREEAEQERQQWIEQGKFVFYWAKDYFMTADGETKSS